MPKILSSLLNRHPLLVLITPSLIASFFAFFNKVEPKEVGLARDHLSGKTWVQSAGIYFTPPWVGVSTVPTTPIRVGIPTGGRGFSAKLVQFEPEFYDDFLEQEGWSYHWLTNRISFNFGNEDEYRGFSNILLGYAYSSTEQSFITILKEYSQE